MLVRILLVEHRLEQVAAPRPRVTSERYADPINNSAKSIYACGQPEDTAAPVVIVVSFDGFGSDYILPLHVDV
jgi:hypothetical protein